MWSWSEKVLANAIGQLQYLPKTAIAANCLGNMTTNTIS